MNISETLKKRWKSILVIIVIVFIVYSIWNFYNYELSIGWGADGAISLGEINESTAASQGNIIHLTEEDFKIFPKLAILKDVKERYRIFLTVDDKTTLSSNYGNIGVFEYKGKYYSYGPPTIF
jgi:hypothetical protein